MKLLLDTHIWLWVQTTPTRIRPEVLELIADTRNTVWLSSASA